MLEHDFRILAYKTIFLLKARTHTLTIAASALESALELALESADSSSDSADSNTDATVGM